MIFYSLIVVAGFAGGYFFAAGYAGKVVSVAGATIKAAELDALGLLDDSPDQTANGSSAGSP
jgi:hypothetical protein